MTIAWRTYQKTVAEFFQSLGLNAQIESFVNGVRGVHKVDVYAQGSLYGIAFKWIVDCKCWDRNVPKEKVMALMSIVQDLGADRGFLLSEKGFQTGAIRAANQSNITLTSIDGLSTTVAEQLREATLGKMSWRLQ